jgi:F0F1-type ATP synthase assembly protein I
MKKQTQFFYYLGLIIQVGLTFSISVFIGILIGIFFDKKLHTSPLFTIIFLIFGIIGGFTGVYKLIKEGGFLEDNARSKKHSN